MVKGQISNLLIKQKLYVISGTDDQHTKTANENEMWRCIIYKLLGLRNKKLNISIIN